MENNNVKKFVYIIVILVIALVVYVLVSKNKNREVDNWGTYDTFPATVESVDVILRESFPVRVDAIVGGYLPDGCSEMGNVSQQLVGNTFRVNLEARRLKDGDVMCTQAIQNFERTITLDNVVGIAAGEYIVDVNGVQKTFTMDVDNYISDFDPLK
jgi:hypothetical protein